MLKLEHLVFSLDFRTGNWKGGGAVEGVRVRLGGALKLINIFNVFGTLHVPSFSILHSVQFSFVLAQPCPACLAQPLAMALALGASSI